MEARIPVLQGRVTRGSVTNAEMLSGLQKIETALGTQDYALVGKFVALVALTASGGAGMAAGAQGAVHLGEAAQAAMEAKEGIEKITTIIALIGASADALNDIGPDAWEAMLVDEAA